MNFFRTRQKYGAKRVSFGGYSFASGLERTVYLVLLAEQQAGIWSEIKTQDHVIMTKAQIKYIPDFRTTDAKTGAYVWHEAKGAELEVWRLKKKLWRIYGPGPLRIYKAAGKSVKMVEEIIPSCEAEQ